jgi:hypothetical protein
VGASGASFPGEFVRSFLAWGLLLVWAMIADFVGAIVLALLLGSMAALLFRVLIGPQGSRGGRRIASAASARATRCGPMLHGWAAIRSRGARPRRLQ